MHTGLDNFARGNLDYKSAIVEVLDRKLSSSQGSEKVNFLHKDEVVAISAEALVRLLHNDNDNISRFGIGRLVALASEGDCLVALHTFVDMNFKDLLLLLGLASVAFGTPVLEVDDLARAGAVVAR